MTGQIPDTFIYKGEEYELIGGADDFLISPEQFGMVPAMMHTACYRGFYCTYELTDDAMLLTEMTLREAEGKYLPIDGVEGALDEEDDEPHEFTPRIYKGLKVPVPFSGKLRLAKDFLREHYVHMGYQKPSAFETVLDITLENGKVTELLDRSEDAARIRGKFKREFGNRGQLMTDIDDAFDLNMDLR